MLNWTVTFFILSAITGLFGFGGIAGASENIAQILFVVFVVLFGVSVLLRLLKRVSRP